MKKITKLFVFLIGILFSVTIVRGQLSVSLPALTANPGDTIDVPITVSQFNNIGAFGLKFTWDSTMLQYDTTFAWNSKLYALGGPLENAPNGGSWISCWSSSGTSGAYLGNATLCIIKFKYTGPGCVSLTWDSIISIVGDINGNTIPTTFVNGSINISPPVINEQPISLTVCDNNNASFHVSAKSSSPLSFKWLVSTNGGLNYSALSNTPPYTNITDSILNISPAIFSLNRYMYECIVSNNCNAVTSSSAKLTVNALPPVNVTPAGPITRLTPVILTANTLNTVTYQWLSGGINIGGATNSTLNVTVTGNYSVAITDKNIDCSNTSNTIVVQIKSLIIDSISANPNVICAGDSSTLTVYPESLTGIFSYNWSTSDTSQSIIVSPGTTAIYKVTVTSDSLQIMDSVKVTVNPLPAAIATPQGPTTFCKGDNVWINANSGKGFSYQWQNSGININGATKSSYTATTSGNYTVIVTQSGCSGTATSSPAIVVTVNPQPTATATPEGLTTFCQGGCVQIDANKGTGFIYQWQNSGININGATASSYIATTNGNYRVIVTQSGCSVAATSSPAIVVTVTATPCNVSVSLPTITANPGDTINVPITGIAFNNIGAIGFIFSWDSTMLQYNATLAINSKLTALGTWGVNADSLGGKWKMFWYCNGITPAILGTATICVIQFTYMGPGCVTLNWDTVNSVVSDNNYNPLSITYIDGSICNQAPVITSQPVSVAVCDSGSANFQVSAKSVFPLSFQWLVSTNGGTDYSALTNTPPYSNVTDSILNISPAIFSMNGYMYECIVSNTNGTNTSDPAILNVNALSGVKIIPESSVTFCLGESVRLDADVCSNYTYQWQKNNVNIGGATTNSYIANASGSYTVIVSQNAQSATSSAIVVTLDSCGNIYGTCFVDENSNCKFEFTEKILRNVKIILYRNNEFFDIKYPDGNGYYNFKVPAAGNYVIKPDSLTMEGYYLECSSASIPVTSFPSVNDISYICNAKTEHEINADMEGWGFRPGHKAIVNFNFNNNTCYIFNANAKFACSSKNVSFTSISPGGIINGDTVIWNFSNIINYLTYFNWVEVLVSPDAKTTDLVCYYAKITPSNNPTDQGSTIINKCYPIKNSWDPNEKEVSPVMPDKTSIYPDSTLFYTINFQNTGNTNAINISILDTLDNNLDVTTLKLVSYSHPVLVSTIYDGSMTILKFTFSNINLTYESSDEVLSHGYVTYSIKPKKGLDVGTYIKNTAYIYFDYNPAIRTNVVQNIIFTYVGLSYVKQNISKIEVFPNPVTNELLITNFDSRIKNVNIIITDMTGKTIKSLTSIPVKNTIRINTADLTPGIYILRIYGNDNTINQYNKIVKL